MPDLTGQTLLNRYRVDAFIDRGGMADVYRGFDLSRQITVALKFMRPDFAEDREFERRFRKEAHALDHVDHPDIVRFYELVRADDHLFMVMEFVDGVALRKHIFRQAGPLPVEEVLSILTPIAAALNYAHAQGVLHRDIKPGNIMLAADGRSLLTDFGIAKLTSSATVTSVMAGTPAYMSPEQCAGKELDARSDVYSLGVLAYELLAGRRPFVGETPGVQGMPTAEHIRSEHLSVPPPSALSLNPQLPPRVDDVLTRVLAKRPQERYASTLEFMQALRHALPGVTESKPVVSAPTVPAAPGPIPSARPAAAPAQRRGFIWMMGALAVVAAVVLGVVIGGRGGELTATPAAAVASEATAAVVAIVETTVVPPTNSPDLPTAAPAAAAPEPVEEEAAPEEPVVEEEPFKAAFVYVAPIGDLGWTWAHDQARQQMEADLGIETAYIELVPEGPEGERVIRDFAMKGYDLIFTTSFGYMDPTITVAEEFPDTQFVHISGYKQAPNSSSVFGRMYQPRYLSGLVAGAATESNIIGYVAAFPIPEVIRGINAFTLGVREVNPAAEVRVVWTNTWFGPPEEKEAADALLAAGADIIAQHQDTTEPQKAAADAGALSIGYDSDMAQFVGDTVLTSPIWNWGVKYVEIAKQVMAGTYDGSESYWGGMTEGVVALASLSDRVSADTAALVEEKSASIVSGDWDVFCGPVIGANGNLVVAEGDCLDDGSMLGMDYWVKGVSGEVPGEAPGQIPADDKVDAIGFVDIAPGEPVHIAYMLATSGAVEFLGADSLGGIDIAIEEYGQLLGHDILLTGEDSLCSAEGGQTAATKVASDPTILGVLGTNCSSAGTAASVVISNAGMLMISPTNTSPALTDPNETWNPGYYRTAHNDKFQGMLAAQFAYNELGLTTAAALHDGDPYTEGLASVFADVFAELGGTVTSFEAINKGDTDMRPVLTSIGVDSPQALYFPIFEPEGNYVGAQSKEVPGLENTVLMGADGLLVRSFGPNTGEAAVGMYLSGPYLSADVPAYANFLRKFEANTGGPPPAGFAAHAYDGANILLSAIEKVAIQDADGTLHVGRQALRDAVGSTYRHGGLTGFLSCDEYGDCATGEALAIFQLSAYNVASRDNWPPEVVYTPSRYR